MDRLDHSQMHPVWKVVVPFGCIAVMYLCLVHPFVQSVRGSHELGDDDEFVDPTIEEIEEPEVHPRSTPDSLADGEADGIC